MTEAILRDRPNEGKTHVGEFMQFKIRLDDELASGAGKRKARAFIKRSASVGEKFATDHLERCRETDQVWVHLYDRHMEMEGPAFATSYANRDGVVATEVIDPAVVSLWYLSRDLTDDPVEWARKLAKAGHSREDVEKFLLTLTDKEGASRACDEAGV